MDRLESHTIQLTVLARSKFLDATLRYLFDCATHLGLVASLWTRAYFRPPTMRARSEDDVYAFDHSREEPNGTRVTFDKEVHFWEAELSMVTEAHRLLEEVQRESRLAF